MDYRLENNHREVDDIDYHNHITLKDVIIEYGFDPSDIRGHEQGIGFGTWCMGQLLEIKKKNGSDFRNHVILVNVKPWLGADVIMDRQVFTVNDELTNLMTETDEDTANKVKAKYNDGDEISVLMLTWYSAIRSRNPVFTKKSFSINEHAWDEIADIL